MPNPSGYTQERGDAICEEIAQGRSLRSICAQEGMPSQSMVFRWLASDPTFREQYARAREAQADALFDEILDIADDGRNDWMARLSDEGDHIAWRENGEVLRRSALRVDARKWMVGKLQPKKYGDKVTTELTGKDGGAIEIAGTTDRDRARAVLMLAAKVKSDGERAG